MFAYSSAFKSAFQAQAFDNEVHMQAQHKRIAHCFLHALETQYALVSGAADGTKQQSVNLRAPAGMLAYVQRLCANDLRPKDFPRSKALAQALHAVTGVLLGAGAIKGASMADLPALPTWAQDGAPKAAKAPKVNYAKALETACAGIKAGAYDAQALRTLRNILAAMDKRHAAALTQQTVKSARQRPAPVQAPAVPVQAPAVTDKGAQALAAGAAL